MAKKKDKKSKPKDQFDRTPEQQADDEILEEARERFQYCVDWESTARARYLEDLRFYYADSENGYQWPQEVRKNRDAGNKPVLTINKVRQFCLNITNDSRQNKAAIKIRPVGDLATFEGSQVMEGIVRHIEYQSNAQTVYDQANLTQVQGGVGYWRVVTDYVDPESFDQEIFIRPIKDPLSVYLDPDAQEVDRSDMMYGFVFTDVPQDKFEVLYPDYKDIVGNNVIGELPGWHDKDHVRVCEYYRRKENKFKLISMIDQKTGEQAYVRDDRVPKELLDLVMADENTKTREVTEWKVEWYKIAGDSIVDRRTDWPGSMIPIVMIVGEEFVVDNKYDRKGHVRNLKDPQRMYNYWTSASTEHVALQTKIPWTAPARAIEGHETYWRTANTENHSILPYNDIDDEGNPIAKPERVQPPAMSEAYMKGLEISHQEMHMASGQYQENLGETGQAVSGKAINARQRQGNLATYHFIDNQAIGLRYTGKLVIELAPKIYDTKRIIRIMGEDGVQSEIQVDPTAAQEYQQEEQADINKIKIIFNPSFAKYSVEADVGPAYATRRQEAFNAFTQLLGSNQDLIHVAGDLMFKAADFPMADELAARLKRLVPLNVLGKGPTPEMQQLQGQNQQLVANLQELMQKYTHERIKVSDKELLREIEEFRAETDRMKVLLDQFSPREIASFTAQLVLETLGTSFKIPQPGNGQSPPAPATGAPAQPPVNQPQPGPLNG